MSDCIFCKIVSGEVSSEKIFESENFIVVKDAYPKVEGHSLVIPKKHFRDFMDLDENLYEELLKTVKGAVGKIGCENFNFCVNTGKVAGQVVFHFHFHILPRREGDDFSFLV